MVNFNERRYSVNHGEDSEKINEANEKSAFESKEDAMKSLQDAVSEALKNMTPEEVSENVERALASRKSGRELLH